MKRCKCCDKLYTVDYLPYFPEEGYCYTCEQEIVDTIQEMKYDDSIEEEEVEDEVPSTLPA